MQNLQMYLVSLCFLCAAHTLHCLEIPVQSVWGAVVVDALV
jgi:hypothetical protein